MATRKNVSASVVRDFLNSDKGQEALTKAGVETKVGSRGRHKPEQIAVFHKANPRLRYETASEAEQPTVEVSGVESIDKSGRRQVRTVTILTSEARAALGHPDGKRGRFDKGLLALALSASNADKVADSFK